MHVHPVSAGNSRCRLGASRHLPSSRVSPTMSASRVTVKNRMNVHDFNIIIFLQEALFLQITRSINPNLIKQFAKQSDNRICCSNSMYFVCARSKDFAYESSAMSRLNELSMSDVTYLLVGSRLPKHNLVFWNPLSWQKVAFRTCSSCLEVVRIVNTERHHSDLMWLNR